jgi:hypothetical protein
MRGLSLENTAVKFSFSCNLNIILSWVIFELVDKHVWSLDQEFIMFFHKFESRVLRKREVLSSFQDLFLKIIDIIDALQN